ncbi:MAG TPA: hypothetical protein VF546_03115 [Pyrinomonadaceae bacterium]|jgi:hypothetical protein
MSTKTTVLRPQRHREFLAAQRQDPVTRKVFVAGDSITLCAACLVPFLAESWQAVGGTHCGQSATTGPEAFETAVETPAADDDGDAPAAGPADGDAAPPAAGLRLKPIPVKLRAVPIKLL